MTRQLPGLRDHKCLDLGGRHSEQSTELRFLGRVPQTHNSKVNTPDIPHYPFPCWGPTSFNPSPGCLSPLPLQALPLRIHQAASPQHGCLLMACKGLSLYIHLCSRCSITDWLSERLQGPPGPFTSTEPGPVEAFAGLQQPRRV